jgi:hypothetical protein
MADPRAGRAGQSGYSPRLGRRDPRLRTNQSGAVTDQSADKKTINTDGLGRFRVTAADGLKPLPAGATAEEARVAYNQLLARLRGQ